MIHQTFLSNVHLKGERAQHLLPKVPYQDFILAMLNALPDLKLSIGSDSRNVVLTLARIWHTVSTNVLVSKSDAASWALNHLPFKLQNALCRAKNIYLGIESERWDDLQEELLDYFDFVLDKINNEAVRIKSSTNLKSVIELANNK